MRKIKKYEDYDDESMIEEIEIGIDNARRKLSVLLGGETKMCHNSVLNDYFVRSRVREIARKLEYLCYLQKKYTKLMGKVS